MAMSFLVSSTVHTSTHSTHVNREIAMQRREILRLDLNGQPQEWVTRNDAASYYATDSVAWTVGDTFATLRGGVNSVTGGMSIIDVHPIIAVRGQSKINLFDYVPSLTNRKLFARDRGICCYCGVKVKEGNLTREHIVPKSKNGEDIWSNCASCCKTCNGLKADKSLEQSGFKLLYVPYVPSLYEDFILQGRNIRADIYEFLAAKLPRNSRLREAH
jgi:HNH endonuclease